MSDARDSAWAMEYIKALFWARGYDPETDDNAKVIESQWPNWKRLLVQTGLMRDQVTAEDVAYEFSKVIVRGSAARIFEHFADFVQKRPQPVREFEAAKYSLKSNVGCEFCDGRGVVMIPVSFTRRNQEVHDRRAYRCTCEAAGPYVSLIQASDEMLKFARCELGQRREQLCQWSKAYGLNEDNPEEYRRGWTKVMQNLRSGTFQTVPAHLDPRNKAYEVYENGDERGELT